MSWLRTFDEPIAVPDGRLLQKLRDAGHFAATLPRTKHNKTRWQTAAHELLMRIANFAVLASSAHRAIERRPGTQPLG
jgi:hypothetical protein